MDYNTQREKLRMPEYGRHVQKMIGQVKKIEDREKRTEQAKAVVQVMSVLNPHLREQSDYRHKLWDHAQVIADFNLDVDAPFPAPDRDQLSTYPDKIPVQKAPLAAACYGRNIENMIRLIADREDDDTKKEMIRLLAHYMRQQYLIWNKDSVTEETIFADIEKLSHGRLRVPGEIHLSPIHQNAVFNRPSNGGMGVGGGRNQKKGKNRNRKNNNNNR